MKKFFTLLLAVALMLSVIPFGTLVSQAATYGNFTYEISGGQAIITSFAKGVGGDVVIPSTLGGYPVTAIKKFAFFACYEITSLTIPSSVNSIGEAAFLGCYGLTSITVNSNNNTFSSIDGVLFNGDATTLLLYPSSKADTDYIVPDTVTAIYDGAFRGCENLKSITISDSVTDIGVSFLENCEKITNVTIPANVKNIGESPFWFSCKLSEINVDKNNEYFCSVDGVLYNKQTTVLYKYPEAKVGAAYNIPDGVTTLKRACVADCNNLTAVSIPDSVTTIEQDAFVRSSKLKNIDISDDIISIGDAAFSATAYADNVNNWHNNALYLGAHLLQVERSFSGVFTVLEGTKTIASNAFTFCENITEIILPGSVVSISKSAFSGCYNLKKINIPDGVKKMERYTFDGCLALEEITIPASVTEMGKDVFCGCENLTIRGYNDSYIKAYAKENNYNFFALDAVTGDVNQDGYINNKDLGALMQKLNGWNIVVADGISDTNGDGSINNKDYGLLMQYCNGWDVELR